MAINQKRAQLADVLPKIRTFCNYRERCHKEVRDKLYALGLWTQDVNTALNLMIEEGLLNEERYARSYVRGHFRIKHWGKVKIKAGLRAVNIHEGLIALAMTEIDDAEYTSTLQRLIAKKAKETHGTPHERKQKINRYMMQKGYAYAEFSALLDGAKEQG